MHNYLIKLMYWGLILSLIVLVLTGLIKFELWSQVYYLRGTSILQLDPLSQPHFLRYALVSPLFYISDVLAVKADFIFSVFCILLLCSISNNSANITMLTLYGCSKNLNLIKISTLMFIFIISSFMNGRILFAMTGFSFIALNIIMWELHKLSFVKMFFYNLLGHFLCSVSTGTFLVSVAFVIAWLIIGWKRHRTYGIFFSYLTLFLILSPVVYLYVLKNLNFYGGGIQGVMNMLNHGAGSVLEKVDDIVLMQILSILFLFSLFSLWMLMAFSSMKIILVALYASIFGGAFGLSTLAVGVPIYLSFSIAFFSKISMNHKVIRD